MKSRDLRQPGQAFFVLGALALGVGAGLPGAAAADHSLTYEGHYGNAFVAGLARDGREVAVMGGSHADFPYHDPGSGYDQIAVYVEGKQPIVVTRRPTAEHFRLKLGARRSAIRYRGRRVRVKLDFRSIEHPPLYEGDPADLGDRALELGLGGYSERRPGFVYVPYELQRLKRGRIVLIERRRGAVTEKSEIRLRRMGGQAETGTIEAPDDPRFRSAYDYIAVAPVGGPRYAYVGFDTHALHSGPGGALDPYFAATASDEFTMQGGSFSEGNARAAPIPFDNTAGTAPGEVLARFHVDLGPGILNRALVSARDGRGARVLALSETIIEDGSQNGG